LAVAAERQPLFVSVTNVQDLVVVSVTENVTRLPPSAYQGLYAVVATDNLSFSLCPGQKEPTVYRLPVYFTGSGQRVKQVLLTPFAVATDLTIVGGVVCLIVCYVEANRCP
jgi:hypothetical protein